MRDWLVAHEVSTERVFLLPTKLGEAGDKPGATPGVETKAKSSRVDFTLK